MTPLGHLSLAFLVSYARGYGGQPVLLCLAGAVLPDLIDKPLVWIGAVDISHTVGHSVVTLGVVAAIVATVAFLRALWPVVVGFASHIAADIFVAYPKFVRNYGWPVLSQRPTPDGPALDYWVAYATSGPGAVEALIVIVAVGLLSRRFQSASTEE